MQKEIQEIYKLIRLNKLEEAENLVITHLKKNNSEYLTFSSQWYIKLSSYDEILHYMLVVV